MFVEKKNYETIKRKVLCTRDMVLEGSFEELENYTTTIEERFSNIEQKVGLIVKDEEGLNNEREMIKRTVNEELTEFKDELLKMEDEFSNLLKRLNLLVGLFHNSVRYRDMIHIRQRVDAWKGEQFITRKEFLKMVSESRK